MLHLLEYPEALGSLPWQRVCRDQSVVHGPAYCRCPPQVVPLPV